VIAEKCRKVPPREAYLAGLLHDLGLILIDQYLNKPFCRVIDELSPETPSCQTEQAVLGFDHASLGQFVAERWNLPEHLTASIGYHHTPLEYNGQHGDMVCVVTLADFFCNLKELSPLGVPDKDVPDTEVFSRLGLDQSQVTQIWEQLDQVLESANIMALIRSAE